MCAITNDHSTPDSERQEIITEIQQKLAHDIPYQLGMLKPEGKEAVIWSGVFLLSHTEIEAVIEALRTFYRNHTPEDINKINLENREKIPYPIEKRPTTPGQVYLLEHGGLYKIGFTSRPIEARIAQIEYDVGAIGEIEVVHTIYTDDVYSLEAYLHNFFGAQRVHGEWFNLSEKDVNYIKSLDGAI